MKGWQVDLRDRALREARAILQDPSRRDLGWRAQRDGDRYLLAILRDSGFG